MNELYGVGQEIEKLFQSFNVSRETLQKLLAKREDLIRGLEVVTLEEAEKLRAQDQRIVESCRAAKLNLEKQMNSTSNRNQKEKLTKKWSPIHNMCLGTTVWAMNWVAMARHGLILWENEATSLRIILKCLPGQKIKKTYKNY